MLVNSMYLVTAINEEQYTYDKGQKLFHNFDNAVSYARKLFYDLNGEYVETDKDYSFVSYLRKEAMFSLMDTDPFKSWECTVKLVKVGD